VSQGTRDSLIRDVAKRTGISQDECREILREIFRCLGDLVREEVGTYAHFRGFGEFSVAFRKKRRGRNVRTGEEVPIPENKTLVWRPHISLKLQIQEAYIQSKETP
jgi:nucleoid DNA-binding protein